MIKQHLPVWRVNELVFVKDARYQEVCAISRDTVKKLEEAEKLLKIIKLYEGKSDLADSLVNEAVKMVEAIKASQTKCHEIVKDANSLIVLIRTERKSLDDCLNRLDDLEDEAEYEESFVIGDVNNLWIILERLAKLDNPRQ